ncbi:phage terminase large subunit family protein, partial [Xylella fastidiosa]|uniref:phage terminase large subunit family protein n=1 Tax=Xylella fastidiosa TaxID=2371 RepID=UPI001F2AFBFE
MEASFLDGDQRHYHIHCPHCGSEQVLDLEHLQPDGTFACALNGCIIQEHHKNTILKERGAGAPAAPPFGTPTTPRPLPSIAATTSGPPTPPWAWA